MAINFSVGDYVIPNPSYIDGSLRLLASTPTLQQTLASLGTLIKIPSRVAATGNLSHPSTSYIQLVPTDTNNISYKGGDGVVIYFSTDTLLNNSLELSTGFIPDEIILRCLNNSGSTITKNQVVRQAGFDATNQVPTIALASASADSTSVILGIAQEDITNGSIGAIVTSGSYQVDTSSFSLNARVYLSNTNGAISTAPGTVNVIIGRVLSVGTSGSIAIASTISGGGGSTDSVFTPGTGTNSAVGKGTTAPTAAGANSFAHGSGSQATQNNNFASGLTCLATAFNSIAIGRQCTASYTGGAGLENYTASIAIGANCLSSGGYGSVAMGKQTTASGQTSVAIGYKIEATAQNAVVLGSDNFLETAATATSAFAVNGRATATQAVAFCRGTASGQGAFAHGNNANASGYYSFAHGIYATASGARTFAHGQRVVVSRDDQRSWGSNRNTPVGGAQSSSIVKYVQTTNATQTTILTTTLDTDKAYSIRANMISWNTTTDGHSASFVLAQALAYRTSAGAAVLVGSPTFTKVSVGTGGTAIAADIVASGNDILVRVTGEAAQTYQWCLDFEFVEVAG